MRYAATIGILVVILVLGFMALTSSRKQADSHAIGLEAGQKAPAFASGDQFGHEQSNGTLKGVNGTVLLFFRSADW
jgi:hypothetical protein